MPAFRLGRFACAAIVGAAFAAMIQPGTGFAYTPEEQQACSPDAMRLCGEFVPNVDAITACMVRKKAQLSPPCAVFFRHGPDEGQAAADPPDRPMSIRPTSTRKHSTSKSRKHKRDDG